MLSNLTNNFLAITVWLVASCAGPSPPLPVEVVAPPQDGCAHPPDDALKIVSFNVHAGRTAPIEQIAAFLAARNPDFAFVQEIDVGVRRTGNVDQFEVLAHALSGHDGHFVKTLEYQGGDYGVAVFSRGALSSIESEELPWDDERRVMVRGVWRYKGADMPFVAGHLGGSSDIRTAQFQRMLDTSKDAVFLLGDFNSTPQELPPPQASGWHDAFASSGQTTASIRGDERRIDYIWTRLEPVCSRVIPTPLSDHALLELTFSAPH